MGYRYLIYVGLTTDSEGRKIKSPTRKFGNAVLWYRKRAPVRFGEREYLLIRANYRRPVSLIFLTNPGDFGDLIRYVINFSGEEIVN